ncbi:hypothetical protein F442_22645 [Phytophthora nicotianae P10297]|uniref:Uncharacterized protein n=3 Tax=Phytophthora nicotianae TaxID=4792 RepID=V9EJW6_PHYNI|nr:hypothetical protein F443_14927 [Phytophthora nicotianae P1569]ETL86359.1 hypothetical protein L917_14208 [Phytophthora nicotianae]ETM39523.1 hypothetical protein L914_14336 [Phytophthora nicotianae]ETP28073.1 hypothetical protein F442_22645 [Phytophthora nicotianae P10297]
MDWTALEIPVRKRGGDSANRLLRAVIAKDERNEDRMLNAAIERLAGLVKGTEKSSGRSKFETDGKLCERS